MSASETIKSEVLHVVHSLNFGGVESQMTAIAKGSHFSKFSHSFVALEGGGAAGASMRSSGASVQILGTRARIPSVSAVLALARIIRRRKPGILHLHGAEAIFHGTIAGLLTRVTRRFAEETGVPNHSNTARLVFGLLYRKTTKVIAPSRVIKEKIEELGEAPASKITLLATPTTLPEARTSPSNRFSFEIAYVGRFEQVKNLDVLLDAFGEFRTRRENVSLTLVGSGSMRASLEKRSEELGVSQDVRFVDATSMPWDRLWRADLFVLPSTSEGFGLSLVEAMAFGLPCLTTPVGIAAEIVIDGQNGWLINEVSSKSLARHFERISHLDPQLRDKVAAAGKTLVRDRFSMRNYFDSADRIYSSQQK